MNDGCRVRRRHQKKRSSEMSFDSNERTVVSCIVFQQISGRILLVWVTPNVVLLSSVQLSVLVWSEIPNACASMTRARLVCLAYSTKRRNKQRQTKFRHHQRQTKCCTLTQYNPRSGVPCMHTKQNAFWNTKLVILHHGTIRCGKLQANRCDDKLKRRRRVWNDIANSDRSENV